MVVTTAAAVRRIAGNISVNVVTSIRTPIYSN